MKHIVSIEGYEVIVQACWRTVEGVMVNIALGNGSEHVSDFHRLLFTVTSFENVKYFRHYTHHMETGAFYAFVRKHFIEIKAHVEGLLDD